MFDGSVLGAHIKQNILLLSVTEALVGFPYLKFANNRIKAFPVPCGFLYL